MIDTPYRFKFRLLNRAIVAALTLTASQQLHAVSFSFGEVEGTFDSTFSYGESYRTENRNWDLIGKSNQPNFNFTGYDPALNPIYAGEDIWANPQGGYSNNVDNGNLNFDAGDAFSKQIKGLHELELNYRNYGLFVRGMYFYDFELMDNDRPWHYPTSGQPSDPCQDPTGKDYACRDIRILDAFVYGDLDFADGDIPVSFRIGEQVISWGESTFIPHGISIINPVDVSRLLAPGAELKEAFIPQGMVWASVGFTENLSMEVYYQYEWEGIRLPVTGTYFSTNDFVGTGGSYSSAQLGFTSNPDQDRAFTINRLNNLDALYQAASGNTLTELLGALGGLTPGSSQWVELYSLLSNIYMASATTQALLSDVIEPDDGGQYGIKFSYFAPELNDTEFGLYFINYHSRRPLISGYSSNFTPEGILADLNYIAANQVDEDSINSLGAFTKAVLEYPEDRKLIGFSFNTGVGDSSLAGEIAYRIDEPLQIDDVELLFAGMPEELGRSVPSLAYLQGISQLGRADSPGAYMQGYVESNTTQAQFTLTHLFGPTLGADNVSFLAEVGGYYIHDMPDPDVLRLNGPGTSRNGGIKGKEGLEQALQGGRETNPFPDKFSWGYRLLTSLDHNNVFDGVNMNTRIVFAHDVNGITPDPVSVFIEDRKSAGITLTLNYLQKLSASVGYNVYWDGVGTTNLLEDRDFASFNVKYSF